MDDPYKVLGVGRDASTEDVRKAYRDRAKATHPDVPGGDEAEFRKVQRALTTLADPNKRAHYDRTGTDDDGVPDNADAQAINLMVGFFDAAIAEFEKVPGSDIMQVDLLNAAKQYLDNSVKGLVLQKQQLDGKIKKLERIEKRLRRKDPTKASTLNRALQAHIDGLRRNLQNKDQQVAAHAAARKLMEEYSFDPDRPMPVLGSGFFSASTTSRW